MKNYFSQFIPNEFKSSKLTWISLLFLSACSTTGPSIKQGQLFKDSTEDRLSSRHIIKESTSSTSSIPAPVAVSSTVLPDSIVPIGGDEIFTVVVQDVQATQLLFSLARDAKINMDIDRSIEGSVTLNAVDQTLPQVLDRIARQIDMRWKLEGNSLIVTKDTPYLHSYVVDYVNLSRSVSVQSSIQPEVGDSASRSSGVAQIKTESKHDFWATLEKNIKDLLRETDKQVSSGSLDAIKDNMANTLARELSEDKMVDAVERNKNLRNLLSNQGATKFIEAASVIINPEAGVVMVRATSRQHKKVSEFLDKITVNAGRQVLIEATIAEVELSSAYQQGVDWQALSGRFSFTQTAPNVLASPASAGPLLRDVTQVPSGTLVSSSASGISNGTFGVFSYKGRRFSSAVKVLESFGNVKVLSSPKLSVMNNQTAVLNVGDQLVYFKVSSSTTTNANTGQIQTSVDTRPKTVSVGLLLSVTPQISSGGEVILNVRPSISSVKRYREDPNPNISSNIKNLVPEIRRREMESVLRLKDGEIAVLGGLMQDSEEAYSDGLPALSRIPILGGLFSYRSKSKSKSELVIFLRPTVMREPSVREDFKRLRDSLPSKDFLAPEWGPLKRVRK